MNVQVTAGEREFLCRTPDELMGVLRMLLKDPRNDEVVISDPQQKPVRWRITREVIE